MGEPFRWSVWAAPKDQDGKIDHNTALTGDNLLGLVNTKLLPHLAGLKQRTSGPQAVEYKIG